MSTSNDDQVNEQATLAASQAKEREQLQEEQNKREDEERTRLQEEADSAHAESEAAQKEALEKEIDMSRIKLNKYIQILFSVGWLFIPKKGFIQKL